MKKKDENGVGDFEDVLRAVGFESCLLIAHVASNDRRDARERKTERNVCVCAFRRVERIYPHLCIYPHHQR